MTHPQSRASLLTFYSLAHAAFNKRTINVHLHSFTRDAHDHKYHDTPIIASEFINILSASNKGTLTLIHT